MEPRLEREGLAPTPEASRETLHRRGSHDLTGLPPTIAEIDAFLSDQSPNAYEKAVDRLLASPRYGERMAERWLDAARYADTNGYQFDGERIMWRWRDWVIDAFNRNQRFDRFALEQIAGDMLPNATVEQKIATGFNRNHRANAEDGIIPEEYAVEYVVDRVDDYVRRVFLGVTLGCARCHNHKYDPFTQKEFYQVFAYFNNVPEQGRAMKWGNSPPLVPAPTREEKSALAELDRKIQQQENLLPRRTPKFEPAAAQGKPVYWFPTGGLTVEGKASGGAVSYAPGRIGDAAVFDGKAYLDGGGVGEFDIEDPYTISAWVYSDDPPTGALATKMDDSPKGRGYGVYLDHGKVQFHLTNIWADDAIRLETEESVPAKRWSHVLVTYSGSRMAEGVHVYIDGKLAKNKVELDSLFRKLGNGKKILSQPFRIGGGGGPERRFRGRIDDVRVYERVLNPQEIAALALGEPIDSIAAKPEAQRSEIENLELRWYYLANAAPADVRNAWKQLTALRFEKDKLERSFPTVMVMAERPVPERHVSAAARRLRQAGRQSGAGSARHSAAAAGGRPQQPAGLRQMGDRSGQSSAGARHYEPVLADVLRNRPGEDDRRLRHAGRVAEPSGAARLAGYGVRALGVGREGDAEADCDERDLPAILEGACRTARARSGEPAAGAGSALPAAGGDGSRSGSVRFRAARRKARRTVGEAVSAGGVVERDDGAGSGLRSSEQRATICIGGAFTRSGSGRSRRP